MPGKIDRNLRKGHLAEDIGITVLRGFSVVADSRQQDDIGVDAYAVLLRRHGRSLFAESTFGVQFKSHSVKNVEYNDRETQWFEEQDIPIFFARVNSSEGNVSFYSPSRFNRLQLDDEKKYSSITFAFDEDKIEILDGNALVGMAPPFFKCSEFEARTDEFADLAYQIFSSWIKFENESIELRKYGIYRTPRWEINGTPKVFATDSKTLISDRHQHLSQAAPILTKLSFHALGSTYLDIELLNAFLRIHKWYIDEGFEEGGLDSPEVLESYIDSLSD